jgi:hypothetical protein
MIPSPKPSRRLEKGESIGFTIAAGFLVEIKLLQHCS